MTYLTKNINGMAQKNILILRGHNTNPGGVVNFYRGLEPLFTKSSNKFYYLRIGEIQKLKTQKFIIIKLLNLFFSYFKLIYLVFKLKINIVQLNPSLNRKSLIRDTSYLILLKGFFSSKVKVISFIHGWDLKISELFTERNLNTFLAKWLFYKSDLIYVLADVFKKKITDNFKITAKVELITTAIDFKLYKYKSIDDKISFDILFLSRFEKEKGIYDILEAAKFIIKDYPYINFLFAGSGNQKEMAEINETINKFNLKDNVKLLGYLKGNEKYNVLTNSSIFILPSYSEGCPVAVLEAMASGLPIVTTRVGCLGSIIIDGENGFFVEPQNSVDIYKKIIQLVNNKDLIKRIAQANRSKARNEFDISEIFLKMESNYENLSRYEY